MRDKIAARLKTIIRGRPVVDLVDRGGPSASYIYRILQGKGNPSVEELDALLRFYGSSLGEFFEPWKEQWQTERLKLALEARTRLQRILDSDIDITGLLEFLRSIDPTSQLRSK